MKPARRAFLLAGGAAAALAATLAAKTVTQVPSTKIKPANAGYALTAHIRNYYRTATI